MVYTVTFNPALDYVLHMDHFQTGGLNRTQSEEIHCGGKGVNKRPASGPISYGCKPV